MSELEKRQRSGEGGINAQFVRVKPFSRLQFVVTVISEGAVFMREEITDDRTEGTLYSSIGEV